jgi:predicted RNA-binding protein associated with RNAse of E/G family
MVPKIRYEYYRPGKSTTTYDEWLVLDRPDVKVMLQEAFHGPPFAVEGVVVLEPGAPIVWFVFPEKWHDVGRFHRADGSFTGWYTNLTTPLRIGPYAWSAGDLFLDLWTPAQGASVWLDEEELETAYRGRLIDRATHRRILNERTIIDLQVADGDWPPSIARDIDLAQALRLQGASEEG